MNIRYFLALISLLVIASFESCDDLEEPIEPNAIVNQCGDINKVACDFEFRKGKWVEVLDSISAIYVEADTIHFIEDTIAAWSFQGEEYLVQTYRFTHNFLYKEPVSGGGLSNMALFTEYNDDTKIFRINWENGFQPIDYLKLE